MLGSAVVINMKQYVKTDREGLVKDMESGAVLNVDYQGLKIYKQKKQKLATERHNSERLDSLEAQLSNINHLLQQLIEKAK